MSAIPFYFGCDHASLLRRLEHKAQNFNTAAIPLLRDLKIRINALSSSVTQSDTSLKEATTHLWPVLRELCLLIQQIVFWCLGIPALTNSIEIKKQAIENTLSQADKETVLKILPFAQINDQGESTPFTIQYIENRATEDPEDSTKVIIEQPLFAIRFEGEEVMTVKSNNQKLSATITSNLYIPKLIEITIELAFQEKSAHLEVSAPLTYHNKLGPLKFQVVKSDDKSFSSQEKTIWQLNTSELTRSPSTFIIKDFPGLSKAMSLTPE